MATVTGMTADAMQVIADASIVDGEVVSGDLILTTAGGTPINAGSVIGPTGPAGTNGTNGAPGATGPAGANTVVALVQESTSPAALTADGDLELFRNNLSVVSGHTYGFWVDFVLQWASFDIDARWDIWLMVNGATYERFTVIQPLITGVSHQPVRGEIFWVAPATQATDDFVIRGDEVIDGAIIQAAGSSTLKRKLKVTDYGILA